MGTKGTLWLAGAVLAAVACNDQPPTEPTSTVDETPMLAASAAALTFYQVSVGLDSWRSCAVTTTNQAYCWGRGYLGDGPAFSDSRPTPVAVAGGYQFRQIATGYGYTCAVTTDNRAFCWGDNYAGQLGDGSTTDRPTPVAAAPGLRFREITAGFGTTCGLTTGDRVYCWGDSGGGKMGTGSATGSWGNPPTQIAGGRTYNQVDIGLDHGCAVTYSREIYCWGRNDYGQIGDSSTAKQQLRPSRVSGTRSFTQVSAGWQHTCAVTSVKRAFCWGENRNGQIGDGSQLNRWEPRQVAGSTLFERVTVGVGHACAESTDNRAYCWGYNGSGALGDGTGTIRKTPVPVKGGLWFAQLSAGNGYSCGVTSENRGYCWGDNQFGELGDGTTTDRWTPTPVAGPT